MFPRVFRLRIFIQDYARMYNIRDPSFCTAALLHMERTDEMENLIKYCTVRHVLASVSTPVSLAFLFLK